MNNNNNNDDDNLMGLLSSFISLMFYLYCFLWVIDTGNSIDNSLKIISDNYKIETINQKEAQPYEKE